MDSALEKAIEHNNSSGISSIFIQEWGMEIYFSALSLFERKKLSKLSKGNSFEMAAYCLILKAKDQEGNPLFYLGDKQKIMTSVDARIVERIFRKIVGVEAVAYSQTRGEQNG